MKLRSLLRRGIGSIALVFLSVFVGLVVLEIGFRLAGFGSDQLLRPHPVLGVSFIPGKHGLSTDTCYTAQVSINSHGWRSPEIPFSKPDDVFRIVVLGDSFMAAVQVGDDDIFAAMLQNRLNARGLPKRVEVINLGVPAYSNDQEYLALREYGLKYHPDFVILAFYSQNDVGGNFSVIERRDVVYPKPFFDVREGELTELPFEDPTPAWIRILRRVVEPIRIYPWFRDRLVSIPLTNRILYELGITGIVPGDQVEEREEGRYPSRWLKQLGVFRTDYDDEWLHAWDITRALLRRIRETTVDHGAAFLLVEIASPWSVMPKSLLADELQVPPGDSFDFDKPTEILHAFASAAEIEFVSLVPVFRAAIDGDPADFADLYLPCDGHWTTAGHRLAAEAIAARLAPVIADRLDSETR